MIDCIMRLFCSDDDRGTISSGVQKVSKNLTRSLAKVLDQEEHEELQENIKSTCRNVRRMK